MDACKCGSGHDRYILEDAAGIFVAYVCIACEDEVRSHYNPRIFDYDSRYSRTGEEEDIHDD